jgi:hypothetical protein
MADTFKSKINPKPDRDPTQLLKYELDLKAYEVIEKLSSVSHDAWQFWSQSIMRDLDEMITTIHSLNQLLLDAEVEGYQHSRTQQTVINLIKKHNERDARWKKQWCAYTQLPEEVKESDRIWAKKAYKALTEKK